MSERKSGEAVRCNGCNGNGNCSRCQGEGRGYVTAVVLQGKPGRKVYEDPCRRCKGSGVCPGCNGSGWIVIAGEK